MNASLNKNPLLFLRSLMQKSNFCLWGWKIPFLCLTVLLICCILKARNCKNIHRNTYSTNRDIYCKTIVAFLECFSWNYKKDRNLFIRIFTYSFNFLSVFNWLQSICSDVYWIIKNSPYCIINHHGLPKGSEICDKDNYWIPRRAKINILHEQFDILLVP